MLCLKNIFHCYDESKWVLNDLSFNFDLKKYVLVGPSGIGKSTLLHVAGKIIQPISGIIESNFKIGFIFQNLNLLENFTLKENIEIAAQIKNIQPKYMEITKLIGIDNILNKYPNQVSGGQKQRAAIARALACGANFILADEPTGNLDVENAKTIRNLFNLINKELNIGYLISTHDTSWLESADKKLKIEKGKLCLFP